MSELRARIQNLKVLHAETTRGIWDLKDVGLFHDISREDETFLIEAHNIIPEIMSYIERLERVSETTDDFIARNHVNWNLDDEDYTLYHEMVKALSVFMDPTST